MRGVSWSMTYLIRESFDDRSCSMIDVRTSADPPKSIALTTPSPVYGFGRWSLDGFCASCPFDATVPSEGDRVGQSVSISDPRDSIAADATHERPSQFLPE